MKSTFLLLIFCLAVVTETQAQAAWDIRYTEIKNVNAALEGKTCKPDFYPLQGRKEARQHHYRYNLSREDTVRLPIGGDLILFAEHRKIYDDWGLYREQYLQSVAPDKNGMVLRLGEFELVQVKGCNIELTAALEYYPANAPDRSAKPQKTEQVAFLLKKRALQGLLFEQ